MVESQARGTRWNPRCWVSRPRVPQGRPRHDDNPACDARTGRRSYRQIHGSRQANGPIRWARRIRTSRVQLVRGFRPMQTSTGSACASRSERHRVVCIGRYQSAPREAGRFRTYVAHLIRPLSAQTERTGRSDLDGPDGDDCPLRPGFTRFTRLGDSGHHNIQHAQQRSRPNRCGFQTLDVFDRIPAVPEPRGLP